MKQETFVDFVNEQNSSREIRSIQPASLQFRIPPRPEEGSLPYESTHFEPANSSSNRERVNVDLSPVNRNIQTPTVIKYKVTRYLTKRNLLILLGVIVFLVICGITIFLCMHPREDNSESSSNVTTTLSLTNFTETTTTIKQTEKAVLNCDNITAYYNLSFQPLEDNSKTFYAQVQFNVHIDSINKQVYLKFIQFNKSNAEDYQFDLINEEFHSIVCSANQSEQCFISFKNLSRFTMKFWPSDLHVHYADLIRIEKLENNRFLLKNAVGNCATSLEGNAPSDTYPTLYNNCFCCGNEYNPDSSLNCPASRWS